MEKSAQKGKTAGTGGSAASLVWPLLMSAALALPTATAAVPADTIADEEVSAYADIGVDAVTVAVIDAEGEENVGVDVNAWFHTANRFYAEGLYDSARVYYTRILDAGTNSSVVHFNLGNTWYRLMKPGMARLHYEKAAVLDPTDEDIRANIDFIKSIIVDRQTDARTDTEFLTAVLYNIHTLMPLQTQLTVVCALLFVLAFLCSAILMKRGLMRLLLAYGAVLCSLVIIATGISAGYKIYAIESREYAVILTQSLDAKNQPAGTQTLFTAHEGTKLRVSKTSGEWSLVSLPNGASGWVTTASLGKI
jgi:tetratricopeptide (TPR) repeat protein